MVGRMFLVGELSRDQYEAAVDWLKIRDAAHRAINAPGAVVEPRDGAGGISDPETANARVRASVAKWDAIRKLVGYDGTQAIELVAVHEQYWPRLVPLLKRALDAVHEMLREGRR